MNLPYRDKQSNLTAEADVVTSKVAEPERPTRDLFGGRAEFVVAPLRQL